MRLARLTPRSNSLRYPERMPVHHTEDATVSRAAPSVAAATSAAVSTTTATNTTPWGYGSQAQANAIVTQVNALVADVAALQSTLTTLVSKLKAKGDLT